MRSLALFCLLTLAACGADGAPERPLAATAATGVTLSGDAQVGVVVK